MSGSGADPLALLHPALAGSVGAVLLALAALALRYILRAQQAQEQGPLARTLRNLFRRASTGLVLALR